MKAILTFWLPLALMLLESLLLLVLPERRERLSTDCRFSDIVEIKSESDGVLEGKFFLKADKPLNSVILVRFAVPWDFGRNVPREGADRMVFYSPYCGDDLRIVGGLVPWHRDFAVKHGRTAFTFTVRTNSGIIGSPDYYVREENGWPRFVFQIRDMLNERFGFRHPSLSIVGESSGGSFAQQIVATYPEEVECAAWNGGHLYKPFTKRTKCMMLASNVWGDTTQGPTVELCRQAEALGMHIERFVTPTNIEMKRRRMEHHAAGPLNYELMTAFVLENDYKAIAARFPPEDFATRTEYIFQSPDNPKKMVVLMVDADTSDGNESLKLMDSLWYLYNESIIPAYINQKALSEKERQESIDGMKKFAESKGLECEFRQ